MQTASSMPGVGRFEDGVGGRRRRHEDHRDVGLGIAHRLFDGVEDRDSLDVNPTFAGGDAGDDLGAVFPALLGMEQAASAGDPLDEDFRVFIEQDGHDRSPYPMPSMATMRCGTVAEVVGALHVEPRARQQLLPLFDLAAVHADHDRQGAVDLGGRFDDPLGDDVAAHDAAEDVDEDPLDVAVLENDLEGLGDLFAGRSAADVEEVGRLAAVLIEHVEGRHGQTGAVDHAADVAGQLDVGEVVFAGGDFQRVELRVVDACRGIRGGGTWRCRRS